MRRLVITAGTGPVEVCRFVADLAAVLSEACAAAGPVHDTLVIGPTEAPRSVTLTVTAVPPGWVGTHLLVDPSRGRGARRRWFAGVSESPAPVPSGPAIDPRDVTVTAIRSGGPGGQHVNTTASAVRAVHGPTGLSVRVDSERSQHANRRHALDRLAHALHERAVAQAARARARARATHHRLVRGAPVRTWHRDARGLLVPTADPCA